MEDVCVQHLEHHVRLILERRQGSLGSLIGEVTLITKTRCGIYLLVKQLLGWFSGFQELFTVKDSMFIVEVAANIPVEDRRYTTLTLTTYMLLNRTNREPEYVDDQLQRQPLDVVVEVALPRSSLSPLIVDVGAAGAATLVQVKVFLQ